MALIRRLPWHGAAWDALRALRARDVHAILLYGPAGIGKKGLALDFAQSLLCESTDAQAHACGTCRGCLLALAGNHPDLRIVVPDALAELRGPNAPSDEAEDIAADAEDAAAALLREVREAGKKASREIRIDQVRELADLLGVSTHRGGARAIVLAPAESLNQASANALLKMLEEPPPSTYFVLVSDSLDDVLPTIRSRCVLQRVAAPDEATALQWLREQGVDDPEARLAAAGGAPLAAVDGAERQLDEAKRASLLALLAQGASLPPSEVAARVPRDLPLPAAITLFQRWGWDLLAYRAAERVRYHPRYRESIARIAAACTTEGLLGWLRSLGQMQATSDHPLNARLIVEAALFSYLDTLQPAALRPRAERGA
jgi:DNA polymerase-3 subunit delta'